MVPDHRIDVWARRIVAGGMAMRLIAVFAWIGFFLNLFLTPHDRDYGVGSLFIGTVCGLLGIFYVALANAAGPRLGRAVQREARRVDR